MNAPDSGSDRAEHRRIVEMLRALRNAHEHMPGVLRHGSCYELYQVLRALYPDAEPWKLDDHVYTRIRGRFYDIHGERKLDADEMRRAVPKFERRDPPHRWRNREAERRRGFAQRTHSIVTVGWEVRALQAAYAAWRRVRHRAWRLRRALRIAHAFAQSGEPEERRAAGVTASEDVPARQRAGRKAAAAAEKTARRAGMAGSKSARRRQGTMGDPEPAGTWRQR